MMTITIDDRELQVDEPVSVLEAAKLMGIKIPTLCYNEHMSVHGGCRLCMVEMSSTAAPDRKKLVPACCTQAGDGMIISTTTEPVQEARRFIIELQLSRVPNSEELWKIAEDLGVSREGPFDVVGEYLLKRAPAREATRCILCGLCVRACAEVSQRDAISFARRGISRKVETPFKKIAESCIGCGSCAYVCPTDAITIEEAG
jgi:NADH dehydrogenase/NADH:ubiquinone oxidoreductase subunit G